MARRTKAPEAEHDEVVDVPSRPDEGEKSEYERFEDLTKRLLRVPREESNGNGA